MTQRIDTMLVPEAAIWGNDRCRWIEQTIQSPGVGISV